MVGQIQRKGGKNSVSIMLPAQERTVTCLHDPKVVGKAFIILDNAVKYSEYKGLIRRMSNRRKGL